ncbi:MAG: hypothetical protein HLUCCO17_16485 [Saliniramus fredricksonii]|uniref:Uncharacterized protein n=1 Tax=Saliniramus fredricksonii TaxID=1653334 RepID=A0A0P7X3F4_9HYPH|nr:MAG: hypothetical protein HLUCCO17_16485 [Saliniramus fredricksonii]
MTHYLRCNAVILMQDMHVECNNLQSLPSAQHQRNG